MALRPPKKRFLPSAQRSLWSENEIGIWEIDCPAHQSLEWSILMAYTFRVLENVNSDYSQFKQQNLFNYSDEETSRLLIKVNPFNDRSEIYSNKAMLAFLQNFKDTLHMAAGKINKSEGSVEASILLKTAANELGFKILVYKIRSNAKIEYVTDEYEVENASTDEYKESASTEEFKKLVLFSHSVPSDDAAGKIEKFTFGLNKDHGSFLQQKALAAVLKMAKVASQDIGRVQVFFLVTEGSLLFGLARSPLRYVIPKLYACPYIAMKLTHAGYETDPRSLDENGLSAFYHTMGLPEKNLTKVLYDFATSNLYLTDSSPRNPDESISLVLREVGNLIRSDYEKSKTFQWYGRKVNFKRYEQFLRFNAYQISISEVLIDLRKNGTSPEQHKQTVISILSEYIKYFNFNDVVVTDDISLFKDFVQFDEYYEMLDFYNCLLFFDNVPKLIPLINEKSDCIYFNAISTLFLTILSEHVFPKEEIGYSWGMDVEDKELMANNNRIISHYYRTCFKENAEILVAELESSKFDVEYVNRKPSEYGLVELLRKSLSSLPQIVDEFLVAKIRVYLEAVKNLSLKDSSMKQVLLIERTIQVIGETLQNTTSSNSVTRFLFRSVLPLGLDHEFFKLRNHVFLKYRDTAVQGRINLENSDNHAIEQLQHELIELNSIFEPVYTCQFLRTAEFLLEKGSIEAKKYSEHIQFNTFKEQKEIKDYRKLMFNEKKDKFARLSAGMIQFLADILKTETDQSRDLKGALAALIYLLSFIADNCDTSNELLMAAVSEFQTIKLIETNNELTTETTNKLMELIDDAQSILEGIFKEMENGTSQVEFPIISSLFEKIKDASLLNPKEKCLIKHRISKYVEESNNLIKTLKENFEQTHNVTESSEDQLKRMILVEKNRSFIRKRDVNKCEIFFKFWQEEDIQTLLQVVDADDSLQDFKDKDNLKDMLLKIAVPKKLSRKITRILNRKMWFLINRIEKFRTILLYENEDIRIMWKSCKWKNDAAIKKRMEFLMVQRYIKEKALRASLETLLLDCLLILDRKELKRLWEKSTDPFSSANLVHVLTHGNPILQTVSGLLSPADLPSEFIDIIMELISDAPALHALCELWERTKLLKKPEFKKAVLEQKEDEYIKLRLVIQKCEKWEKYLELLPMKY